MLRRILKGNQDELLAENRRLLAELQTALARFDASDEDQATVHRAVRQLDELFLLVVAGEFNAGKSAFINALLGEKVLEEGVTPTTTRIHLIKHGPAVERTIAESALDVVTAPVELLADINIVDTPGTNAIHREHEAITREFVPRSDMVLFVTSADRPFTESERAFLQGIREWGKKVVVVVNKIDILETAEDVQRILAFIAEHARALLGFTPEIFPVSAKRALRAKLAGDQAELVASRFDALERYIVETLDERERVRLKLMNPLGIGRHLSGRYLEVVDGRLTLLKEDVATLEDIDRQLGAYKEDMGREFRYRLSDVDNALHEFEKRGDEFFEETMRLARVFDLMNKDKVRADFERKVIADAPQQIERRVTEIIDWLVTSDLKQWEAVSDHLSRRRQEHADRIVGRMGRGFDFDRSRLLETVGRAAQRSVETYDRQRESLRMAESVQSAVASTALVEVGAIGLGAVIAAVGSTVAVDVTGVLAASAVAILGLFIIPARRREAKKDLHQKIAEMREKLMEALTTQFDREIERSIHQMQESMAPYSRFVRSERTHLDETRGEMARIQGDLERLRTRVEAM